MTVGRYDHETETIQLSDGVIRDDGCRDAVEPAPPHPPTGRPAARTGDRLLRRDVRHELQHRTDAIEWWGSPRGAYRDSSGGLFSDPDGDHVPSAVESTLAGCSSFGQKSCDARPFDDVTDSEIRAYYSGWQWPLGSVDRDDWSCGDKSKQWHGKSCPQ